VSSQPIKGGGCWCALRSKELLIGDQLFPVPCHLDAHVSIVTMLTQGDTWKDKFQQCTDYVQKKGAVKLYMVRNDEIPAHTSPSVYNFKLHSGDWNFFHPIEQRLASAGSRYGIARTLGCARGPKFHLSIHRIMEPCPTRPCPVFDVSSSSETS